MIAARNAPVHDPRPAVGAEQPASQEHAHMTAAQGPVAEYQMPADNLNMPLSTTPLFGQMMDNLASVDNDEVDIKALVELENTSCSAMFWRSLF